MSYQISDPVSLTLSTVLFPLTNLGIKAGEIRFLTNGEIVQRQGCGPGLGQLDILCPMAYVLNPARVWPYWLQ